MADPTLQCKAGWLQKRGALGLRTWAKRWFELGVDGVSYYWDDSKKDKRGSIQYNDIISVTTPTVTPTGLFSSNGGYFQIETKGSRVYYLYAESKEETDIWVNILKDWVASYKASTSPQQTPPSSPNVQIDSPYSQYLEFQHQPLYSTPSLDLSVPSSNLMFQQTAPHSHMPIQPPPPPPRPLRVMTHQQVQGIFQAEGDLLKAYIDIQVSCCGILMTQNLNMAQSGTSTHTEKKACLLCAYLVLSSLDWDNRNTLPSPFMCSPSYESDSLFPYFVYAIALLRQEILSTWPVDGATVVTQIDTWIKRKRKDHQLLVQQEDRQAFLHRNLALVYQIKNAYLTRYLQLDDAFGVLVDRLLESMDHLPQGRYGEVLWKGVESRVPENERSQCSVLLWAYLVFQKLKLENDKIGFSARDPYLGNQYLTILTLFHNAIAVSPLNLFQRDIQMIMMKIFGMWQRDLPLLSLSSLSSRTGGDFKLAFLSNSRAVGRIAVNLSAVGGNQTYAALCDALRSLQAVLYQRYIAEGNGSINNLYHNTPSTPFPALPSQNMYPPVMGDDMKELAHIAQRALLV